MASTAPAKLARGSLATSMDDQRKVEQGKKRTWAEIARQQRRVNVPPPQAPSGGVKERMWPSTLMVLGLFSVIFTLAWTGRRTLVPIDLLARALVLLCVIGTLVPY